MRPLYRSNTFVASRLILHTHLKGNARFPEDNNLINVQVFLAITALISSQNASHHKLASGRRIASANEGGSLSG